MRKMKDSGIAWIGEIPEEWQVSRVGLHYEVILGKMLRPTQISDDYSLEKYYCAANVHFDGISDEEIKEMWFSSSEKEQYAVKEGDLLVVEGGAGAGGCAIVKHLPGPMYIQNSIMIVRGKNNHSNSYLGFLIQCLVKMGYIDVVCNKATIPHFTKDKLSNTPYLISADQARIVSYLDTKCTHIDAVIEKTRASIEEYKKLKQAVITQAVTKGIRPNRAMKDSGVEWVRELPVEWNVIPAKYLFRNSDVRRQDGDEQMTASQQYGIISQRDYMDRTGAKVVFANKGLEDWKHVEPFDFIISLRSFQGGLEMSETTGCITWHYIVLKPCRPIHSYYFKWLFKSQLYIKALQGTCNFIRDGQDLRYSNFIQVPLFEPSIAEQQEIADYLDEKCSEIDKLVAKKEQYLSELESLKKSLIYEYVTGKKEVPA